MKRWLKILFKLVISCGLIFLLFHNCKIDLKSQWLALRSANISMLTIAFLLAVAVLFLKGERWRSLVMPHGRLSIWEAFKFYLSSYGLGTITPGRLGEFFKIYQLTTAKDIPLGAATEATLSDRCFDMFFLLWIGVAGLLFWRVPFFAEASLLALGVVLAAGLTALFVVIAMLGRTHLTPKHVRLNRILTILRNGVSVMLTRRGVSAWGMTLAAYLVYFYADYLVLHAYGVNISYTVVCFTFSVVGLVVLLPISIAGLGTREAIMVLIISQYNFSQPDIIAASLSQFAIFFMGCGLLGIIMLNAGGVSVSDIKKQLKAISGSGLRPRGNGRN